jgi:hypothetical protein
LPGFPCLAQNIEREALMDVVSLVVAKKNMFTSLQKKCSEKKIALKHTVKGRSLQKN